MCVPMNKAAEKRTSINMNNAVTIAVDCLLLILGGIRGWTDSLICFCTAKIG